MPRLPRTTVRHHENCLLARENPPSFLDLSQWYWSKKSTFGISLTRRNSTRVHVLAHTATKQCRAYPRVRVESGTTTRALYQGAEERNILQRLTGSVAGDARKARARTQHTYPIRSRDRILEDDRTGSETCIDARNGQKQKWECGLNTERRTGYNKREMD